MSTTNTDILNADDPEEQRRLAASIMGQTGGRNGTGQAKRRSPEKIQKAVRARIKANQRRKRARVALSLKATPSTL